MPGSFREEILLRSKSGTQSHDGPFANGINRRIGDLGKELLEVGEKEARIAGKGSERDVIAHRENRFLSTFDHGREHHVKILGGNALGDLVAGELHFIEINRRDVWLVGNKVLQFNAIFVDPFGVRFLSGELLFDLLVSEEFTRFGVS